MLELLKKYTLANGISGFEKDVGRIFFEDMQEFSTECYYDNLGSVIARVGSKKGKKIMFAGHMDEIGFVVKAIDENGFIKIHSIGGWWNHVICNQLFTITTASHQEITALSGYPDWYFKGKDARNKVMSLDDIYLDLGVASRKEVEDLGVRVGDPITPKSQFIVLNDKYILTKALDDRISLVAFIEALKELDTSSLKNNVYFVATVQEERGGSGAKTASALVDPDFAIAIDVTFSNDTPGKEERNAPIGSGVCLTYVDSGAISNVHFLRQVEQICRDNNLPFTHEVCYGGTDAANILKNNKGVPVLTIGLPTRYMHSHYTMASVDDLKVLVKVIAKLANIEL